MQYFSSFLLFLSLFINIGSIAVAQDSKKSESSNKYDPEFIEQYHQECMETSIAEGLDEIAAEKLCNCTISEFQKQHTQAEFVRLTTASATDENAENSLIEVGQVCFEQTLYE